MFLSAFSGNASYAVSCSTSSPVHRVPVLELYTSQGCSSCPPADRWLSGLRARGFGERQLIPLAFHVDYWDYIGWKDRFARPAFTRRQQQIASRNEASFVYTPQFVLDGKDYRRPWLADRLSKRLREINGNEAAFDIALALESTAQSISFSASVRNRSEQEAHFFIALVQSGLSSEVRAGENAGRKLYHDFVVRELTTPVVVAPGERMRHEGHFDLAPGMDLSSMALVAFAEAAISGTSMQATSLAACP